MRKRTELNTDIATVGLWDPAFGPMENEEMLLVDEKACAKTGRVFFINTGADGGFPTDIYVDEAPPADKLEFYSRVNREFLVECRSGRFVAGGMEDFPESGRQITSKDDEFNVPPGKYALAVHQINQEKLEGNDNMRLVLGSDDLEYYDKVFAGRPWGWLLFAIACVLFVGGFVVFQLWFGAAVMFVLWVIYVYRFFSRIAADERYVQINERIGEYLEQFPQLIFVLRPLDESTRLEGGWLDLIE